MKYPLKFSVVLSVAVTSSLSCYISPAHATKLIAQPLPHEETTTNGNATNSDVQFLCPPPSRFHNSLNLAEQEKEKAETQAKAKQKALETARKLSEVRGQTARNIQLRATEANRQAILLGKVGHWLEAIQSHEKAVQLDPTNKQFRINLSAARTAFGQQQLAEKDFSSAAHLFRQALIAAPDNGLAGRLLVETLKKSGSNPNSAEVRLVLGDQFTTTGNFEDAAIEYQAALELENSARTNAKMGDLALHYGQMAIALSWYRQALSKQPDFGPAHRQLGLIALAQNDLTSAASSLRKAMIYDAKDNTAGQALVDLWRKQLSSNPSSLDNHLGLAGALQLTGDLSGADNEYQQIEAVDPKHPGLKAGRTSLQRAYKHLQAEKRKLAAETLFNQGLRREALAEISQAVMLEPHNATYQLLLGECLEANGNYKEAHQAYLTCVLIDPENNQEAAARMSRMQNIPLSSTATMSSDIKNVSMTSLFSTKQKTSSLAQVNQTVSATSDAKIQVGQNQNNAPQLDDSATNDHDSNNILSLVSKLESNGDFQGAARALADVVNTNLNDAELHHRLAVDLMNAGDITQAVSEFRIASALMPEKKAFSDDLARALAIHKRSFMSTTSVNMNTTDLNGSPESENSGEKR